MPHVDSSQTFGPLLVGAMLTMGVYGITILQVYLYYTFYPKDGYGVKALVAVIWILDTIHVILMCHTIYHYLITGFGDVAALGQGTWSLFGSIAINIVIAFTVQCFFTQRIFTLSSHRVRWWLSSIISFVVFAHFCFGMETVVYFFVIKDFSRLGEAKYISVLPFGVTAILSDIMIATALCFLLASNRSEFEDTNLIIHKLIIFAINRCILTSVVAIVEVVVFVVLPDSFYTFAFDFIIGKLYANSLLATLNSRSALRGKDLGDTTRASTNFRLASVATRDEPITNILRASSQDSETEQVGRRRVPSMTDGESKNDTMINSTTTSKRYYKGVNL